MTQQSDLTRVIREAVPLVERLKPAGLGTAKSDQWLRDVKETIDASEHCDRCGGPLTRLFGDEFALCGDCYGGTERDPYARSDDGSVTYEREQQARIQRELKR